MKASLPPARHAHVGLKPVCPTRIVKARGLQNTPPAPVEDVAEGDLEAIDSDNFLAQVEAAESLEVYNEDRPFPLATLPLPVYSLSTLGAAGGGSDSMNLVTYAAQTSLDPVTMSIALYRDTQTWANFLDSRKGVLQILRSKHLPLCQILGKTSASNTDKTAALTEAGAELAEFFGHTVLANCYGLMELEMVSGPHNVGDHDVVICEVGMHMTNRSDASDVLTTLELRTSGVLVPDESP